MEHKKLLEELVESPKRGEGKADGEKAVAALMALSSSKDNIGDVARYIASMHFSVCHSFFLEYCARASDGEVNALVLALLDEDSMKNKNPNLFIYPKGYAAMRALAERKKHDAGYSLIKTIIDRADGRKGFATSAKSVFEKIFETEDDIALLYDMLRGAEAGLPESEKIEKNKLAQFLSFVDAKPPSIRKTAKGKPAGETESGNETIRFAEQISEIEFKELRSIKKTQSEMLDMLKSRQPESGEKVSKEALASILMPFYSEYTKHKGEKGPEASLLHGSLLSMVFGELVRIGVPLERKTRK